MVALAQSVFEKNEGAAWRSAVLAFFLFGAATLLSAPFMGYGHVPFWVAEFSKQLDEGVAYQTVASSKEGEDEYVLLVKKFGTSYFRAFRVKTMPPEIFTLINGQPVAIATPGTK